MDELPGMGGARRNENFILNVSGWEALRGERREEIREFLSLPAEMRIPNIALAPITGAVENIGFPDERDYYHRIVGAAASVGIGLCIGDGYPDTKIRYGIEAVEKIGARASVFIKPYSNEKILERIEWSAKIADSVGIDIDSFNILTMRNLAKLEKKSAEKLREIMDFVHARLGVKFAVKGIFTKNDLSLMEELKPDIAYISNHGGRVDTRRGSTAEFLSENARILKKSCTEVWVDGGIRTPLDVATAHALGADRVLIGRPFVSALCLGGEDALCRKMLELSLVQRAR